MTEREWSKLCRNIFDRKCILMIGSEFQIEMQNTQGLSPTTFGELLQKRVAEDVLQYPRLPDGYEEQLATKDFCQIARDFIAYGDNSHVQAREDLEVLVSDYLEEISAKLSSESFTKLASLPFSFIIDTNYGSLFYELLRRNNKRPKSGYYHFKGDQLTLSDIGTEQEPFVYNLYGSVRQPKSLAITDYDLVQLLINIISKSPGLPVNVRALLADEETSILFLGFGILAKNWYFRILLHALTAGNKKTMSYALEYLAAIDDTDDPTVLFFKDELKVCLYHFDQKSFIDTLAGKYQSFMTRQAGDAGNNMNVARVAEEVKVFISYKREDLPTVREIVKRLEANSVSVLWDQSTEFTGDWERRIKEMIDSSNAFILLQSKSLKENPENYVNVETRLAMKKAQRFSRLDSFLYPAFIDSINSRLTDTDFDFVNTINNWDLSAVGNVDNVAKEIFRNQERNKKAIAA